MPTYEYECTSESCKDKSERKFSLVDFDRTKEIKCDKCGRVARRVVSPLRTVSSTWKS